MSEKEIMYSIPNNNDKLLSLLLHNKSFRKSDKFEKFENVEKSDEEILFNKVLHITDNIKCEILTITKFISINGLDMIRIRTEHEIYPTDFIRNTFTIKKKISIIENIEHEIVLANSDKDKMITMLKLLGLREEYIGEKYRQTFYTKDNVQMSFNFVPGRFITLEIEAPTLELLHNTLNYLKIDIKNLNNYNKICNTMFINKYGVKNFNNIINRTFRNIFEKRKDFFTNNCDVHNELFEMQMLLLM